MKLKYFAADSYEAAVARACEYYACMERELYAETCAKGGEGREWLILAGRGRPVELDNINGAYALSFEKSGVYFELYEHRGKGLPVNKSEVTAYLARKNVKGLDVKDAITLMGRGSGRVRVAPQQEEITLSEDIAVEISADKMEAKARILPPDEGGGELSVEEAISRIRRAGVVFGIDEKAVEDALRDKLYNTVFLAARGQEPRDGSNGELTFHFSTDARTGRPKILEDGRVDYKTLDLIEPVKEGQLLVSRRPATKGEPGMTVMGKPLTARDGRDVMLPRSKNTTTNEDGTALYAATGGMVDFVNNVVTVSNIYTVNGDCDMSVGNIDFDGSVYISGGVIAGQRINATGNIMIDGVVEAAEITAGGNIEIKRGIQGSDKGRITAGGSVTAHYIERCTVSAEDSITIDAAIQSDLEAGRSLTAMGKRGCIIGGLVRVGGEITANVIGSNAHTLTEIEVGMIPQKRARAVFLERELENISTEAEKLDKIDQYLEKTKGTLEQENWARIALSAAENRRRSNQLFAEYTEELSVIKREAEEAVNGRVHVFSTTFPGVKITISSGMYRVNDNVEHATFKFRDGEVVFMPYEGKRP